MGSHSIENPSLDSLHEFSTDRKINLEPEILHETNQRRIPFKLRKCKEKRFFVFPCILFPLLFFCSTKQQILVDSFQYTFPPECMSTYYLHDQRQDFHSPTQKKSAPLLQHVVHVFAYGSNLSSSKMKEREIDFLSIQSPRQCYLKNYA